MKSSYLTLALYTAGGLASSWVFQYISPDPLNANWYTILSALLLIFGVGSGAIAAIMYVVNLISNEDVDLLQLKADAHKWRHYRDHKELLKG